MYFAMDPAEGRGRVLKITVKKETIYKREERRA